jgi:hypothetical protein
MSFKAIVAIIVDVLLGVVLFLISVVHVHLTVRDKNGDGVIVPEYQVVIPILIIMGVTTAWWLLGRRRRKAL